MNPFAEAVSRWGGFFGLAGAVSATLAGLLFVTVSLHVDVIAREESKATRVLARQTLTNYMYIVIISLVFLVPNAVPASVGLPLLAIGLLGCNEEIRLGLRIRQRERQEPAPMPRDSLLRRLIFPTASYAVITVVSLLLLAGLTDGLYWMVAALILILLNATINSWLMLIQLAALKQTERGNPPPTGQQ